MRSSSHFNRMLGNDYVNKMEKRFNKLFETSQCLLYSDKNTRISMFSYCLNEENPLYSFKEVKK
jgi:hypothetical protein